MPGVGIGSPLNYKISDDIYYIITYVDFDNFNHCKG